MDSSDHTPLHSAARSNDLEAAELLLKEKGIDIYAKDERGMTALHILIKKRIEEIDNVHDSWREKYATSDEKITDKFIGILLKHASTDSNRTKEMKLLEFHAACTLENCDTVESLMEKITDVNQSVSENSSIWPGYTSLHFAAHCNVDTIKMLIAKGGNLLTCDATGVTPLDICIKSFHLKEVQSSLMSVTAWKDILFSDGKTKLMDYVSILHESDGHKKFLQSLGNHVEVRLSQNSPLWPGYTILHVAVVLLQESELDTIHQILNIGANVSVQDCHGSTPAHLAFRQDKLIFSSMLLDYHNRVLNPVDKDNLSLLHIACASNHTTVVKKLLSIKANIDIAYNGKPLSKMKPGWTPLHIACFTEHLDVVKILLEAGANLLQTDTEGFTAIHRLFGTHGNKSLLLDFLSESEHFKDCVVEGVGLTHFHVMAHWNKAEVVEWMLNSGSDIEGTIGEIREKNLKQFVGYRPLHLALMYNHFETVKALLDRGADILARKPDGTFPLSDVLIGNNYKESILELFSSAPWTNEGLEKRMEREMGLTMLHIACRFLEVEKIKNLLHKKVDVNARIHEDSLIWPGFTPLHVLTSTVVRFGSRIGAMEKFEESLKLLLNKKADVALTDVDGNTPVHLFLKFQFKDEKWDYLSLLIKHHSEFNVNPRNTDGFSHFHVACLLCNSMVVKGFLQCGADANQPISKSAYVFAGCSPLHLSLNPQAKKTCGVQLQLETVNLLLEHGANLDVVDARGWTPLHYLAKCRPLRQNLIHRIVTNNTDMNRETVNGETPFEILIRSNASIQEIKFFIDHGSRVNGYNRLNNKGYMAMILSDKRYENSSNIIFGLMMSLPDITEVDERGRNAIYNALCDDEEHLNQYDYAALIDELIKLGCDLHQEDREGKTPLHVAVELQNLMAVDALLACGADVNLVDFSGESPFSCSVNTRKYSVSIPLVVHLTKLRQAGLEISPLNMHYLIKVIYRSVPQEVFRLDQLEKTKEIKIGERGLTLYDFVFERDVVKLISLFTPTERDIVGTVLDNIDYKTFDNLKDLLKLQYRKVLERLPLIEPAAKSFNILLGFPMPYLCVEVIFKFLTNVELKRLVSAAIQKGDRV